MSSNDSGSINDGNTLEMSFRVEDPGAFNAPWTGTRNRQRVLNGPLDENICAEDTANFFNHEIEPLPTAERPDFCPTGCWRGRVFLPRGGEVAQGPEGGSHIGNKKGRSIAPALCISETCNRQFGYAVRFTI